MLKDFDATSLYPSAICDDALIYPKKATGRAFTPDINNDLVEKFNSGNFNQTFPDLKVNYFSPPDLFFQHLLAKELVIKIEVNRMQKRYVIDTSTSVDFKENIGSGGKILQFYDGVI